MELPEEVMNAVILDLAEEAYERNKELLSRIPTIKEVFEFGFEAGYAQYPILQAAKDLISDTGEC